MRSIKFTLVLIVSLPLTAQAAELPIAKIHKSRASAVHRVHVVHVPKVHFGYYWYRWGRRTGGTRYSWYGSTFALADPWW